SFRCQRDISPWNRSRSQFPRSLPLPPWTRSQAPPVFLLSIYFCTTVSSSSSTPFCPVPLQLLHLVSQSPDYFQISGFSGIDLDLFPDMADMDRHRVICGECFLVPDIFVNLTDRKDSSLILDEEQKDAVLDGRKLHQVAVHPDFFLIVVHRKAS